MATTQRRKTATSRQATESKKFVKREFGELGRFEMVPKGNLGVDPVYQRGPHRSRVNDIRSNFSWESFGCVSVFQRDDGSRFIIDGQQRWLATLGLDTIDAIPCMIIASRGPVHEAETFLRINRSRTNVAILATFKARKMAGDTTAIAIQALVSKYGIEISNSKVGKTFSAIGALEIEFVKDAKSVENVLAILSEVCVTRPVDMVVFQGLCYIEENMSSPSSLMDLKARIISIGYAELLAAARSATNLQGGSSRRRKCGEEILSLLNQRSRKKIVLGA